MGRSTTGPGLLPGTIVSRRAIAADPPRRRELLGLLDSWSDEGRNGRQTPLWLADWNPGTADVIARRWSRSFDRAD